MKCPECGAWSDVKETRTRGDGSKYRRYECGNMHRFSTSETITTPKRQSTPRATQPNPDPSR